MSRTWRHEVDTLWSVIAACPERPCLIERTHLNSSIEQRLDCVMCAETVGDSMRQGGQGSWDGYMLTATTLGLGSVLGTCASVSVFRPSLPAEATTSTPRWFRLLTEACQIHVSC